MTETSYNSRYSLLLRRRRPAIGYEGEQNIWRISALQNISLRAAKIDVPTSRPAHSQWVSNIQRHRENSPKPIRENCRNNVRRYTDGNVEKCKPCGNDIFNSRTVLIPALARACCRRVHHTPLLPLGFLRLLGKTHLGNKFLYHRKAATITCSRAGKRAVLRKKDHEPNFRPGTRSLTARSQCSVAVHPNGALDSDS